MLTAQRMCEAAVAAAGLEVVALLTAASTRNEKGAPVQGLLVVASAPPSLPPNSRSEIGEVTVKNILKAVAAVLLVAALPNGAVAQEKVRIAVGGKSAVFYLPLSVAERLGTFKDAGPPKSRISDVASGGRTLQSIVGGSAEIGIGTFDHAIQMAAKNQPVVALLQYGRYPGFMLAMMAGKADLYKSPKDLKRTEDRRDVAGFQHDRFHGGLYDGAQRAQGRRRLVRRHRHHVDRAVAAARRAGRSTPSSAPTDDDDDDGIRRSS